MSEFRRRLFFAQATEEPIILPDGYTKYDWIQGDGTAYIDSGVASVNGMALEVEIVYPSASTNKDCFIGVSFERGINYGRFELRGYAVGDGRPAFYNHNGSTNCVFTSNNGSKMRITAQGKNGQALMNIYSGNSLINTKSDTRGYTTQTSFGLNIYVCQNSDTKIYRAKVYTDYDMETLAWDGIPCIDPNGVRGMYDLVSETFFSNAAGSGAFSLGFDNHVPQGYREVEWVGANKDAQIAFSITSLATLKEEIRVKWTNFSGRQIMGLESGSGYWGYDGSKYEIAALSTGIAPTGGWDDLVITRSNNGIDCTINGTSISRLAKAYSAATNFNLFKVYGMGCACQIAEYKIGDGVTLYHDLVPCVRMSDNQPGFYDILQGKFHAGGTSVGAFVNS